MSKIQLTETGRSRLLAALVQAESGQYKVVGVEYDHNGNPMYYRVLLPSAFTCCFVSSEDEIKADLIQQITNTLTDKLHIFVGYFGKRMIANDSGGIGIIPLNRSDYSTPAQRALESHSKRLNARAI